LEDFTIADMTEIDDAQIILGRPLRGMFCFCFMDEKVVSPNSSLSNVLPLSLEIDIEDGLNC